MIKRLIFDVDGTLITGIDFREFIEKALKKYHRFSEQNVEKFMFAIADYEKHFNYYDRSEYLAYFSSILNTELDLNFLNIFFNELKYAIPKENNELFHILSELSTQFELVLLSNYFEESQRNRLNHMGIGQFFSEYYGEKLIKPNKQVYIDACGRNNPNECIMIGDDPILDIQGAKDNGLHTIFINTKKIAKGPLDTIRLESVKCLNKDIIDKMQNKSF